jgi:hypothetical protein
MRFLRQFDSLWAAIKGVQRENRATPVLTKAMEEQLHKDMDRCYTLCLVDVSLYALSPVLRLEALLVLSKIFPFSHLYTFIFVPESISAAEP